MNTYKIRTLFCVVAALMPGGRAVFGQEASQPTVYLFSYFTGDGREGLHLAYSHDGLRWKALKEGRPFLEPRIGGKLMRDPSIARGPDGTFHLTWTTGWWKEGVGIGIAHSKDLIGWSEQTLLPVMEQEPKAVNCWAPEIYYDEETDQFLIFWATTIPGRFTETADPKDEKRNHRMYYIATRNFKTYTETALFYDPGFSVIDTFLLRDKENDRYVLFLKNETNVPAPEKNIRVAFAENAAGPYGPASEPITGNYWAEGPSALKIDGRWIVYFDKYIDRQYGAVASYDLEKWDDISDQVEFPPGARHGTTFAVSPAVLEKLMALEAGL